MIQPDATNDKNQNSRQPRPRETYLEDRARIYYKASHPALVGPRHPDAPPVRHPRALTIIMREACPLSRGLGTPATPTLGTQGVLRRPSTDKKVDKDERTKMRAVAFSRVDSLLSRRASTWNRWRHSTQTIKWKQLIYSRIYVVVHNLPSVVIIILFFDSIFNIRVPA
jgi:hypothetical protein